MPDVLLSGDSPVAERPATPEHVCHDPIHHDDYDLAENEWVHLPSIQQFVNSLEGETSSEPHVTPTEIKGKVGETTEN